MLLDSDPWDSTISFQPAIPVELGGSLELTFAADVDPTTQIGRTFKLFDWAGVNPAGQFNVVSDYPWDTANLYTTGEVTLIPEPASWALATSAPSCRRRWSGPARSTAAQWNSHIPSPSECDPAVAVFRFAERSQVPRPASAAK